MVVAKQVGARVRRREDPRLITGGASYVDDLRPDGTAHLAFLRSAHPHATIRQIDTRVAAALPGVIAVYTGADFQAFAGPVLHGGGPQGVAQVATWALARDTVRYLGQPLAVVVAEERASARDALDRIVVEYTPLPAVTDLTAALAPDAPQLHAEAPGNVAYRWERREGDPDTAFADAEVIVREVITNQRVAGLPLEPRGVLARPATHGARLLIHTSTQNPHVVRRQLAAALGLSELDIRVIAPEVGGSFGVKTNVYPEEVVIAALALHLQRPVKWIETRGEHLAATHHGRAQRAEIALAAQRDGTITGLRLRLLADLGAYPRATGVALSTAQMLTGVYGFKNVDLEIRGVYTTTMATGAYRGAGRPEAAYYLERMVDILADELGLDPVALRRKNFIPPDAFPYKTPTGAIYDSSDYGLPLDRALALADYAALRAEQRAARQAGRYLGIGVTTFTEICGFGATESAHLRVEPDGSVTVATGFAPSGQGQETTFAQLIADELAVPPETITVAHGDTALVAQSAGTGGVRGVVVGGSAVVKAAAIVRERAIQIAAYLLEVAPGDLRLDEQTGNYVVQGAPAFALTLAEIAQAAYSETLPKELGAGLEAVGTFSPPGATAPFGADVAVVEVDPDTGEIRLLRYIAVDDCGRAISPFQVDGQLHGGLVQGIGQALWEEVVYDEDGQLLTGSLLDYAMPRAAMLPSFALERTETPSPLNPLGAKGAGELGIIGSAPAIVNAVVDALSPFGLRHLDMPLRPERIWRAIRCAQGRSV